MMERKRELFGLGLDALEEFFLSLGLARYRSKQVYNWLYKKFVFDFAAMSDIAKGDREVLADKCSILPGEIEIAKTQRSADGLTEKVLLRYSDGALVESVLMEHDYGHSVCLSSQVGCPMGCRFCASGQQGLERDLTAAEILAQGAIFGKHLAEQGKRWSRLVVMGSGEPFLNYANVLAALDFFHRPDAWGLSYRHMTVSTCGIVPGIERLAREGKPINLAISLHSVRQEVRSALMPANKVYPFPSVLKAAAAYGADSGRQVTYEYILIAGLNHTEEDAELLASYLKGQNAAVNLIPANPVPDKGIERPAMKDCRAFCRRLQRAGLNATLRKEMGKDIAAACGQLRGAAAKAGVHEGGYSGAGDQ